VKGNYHSKLFICLGRFYPILSDFIQLFLNFFLTNKKILPCFAIEMPKFLVIDEKLYLVGFFGRYKLTIDGRKKAL